MHAQSNYDVIICGAGLAGLTLARQLKLELPTLSIAALDRVPRPLPEAAHKVGEATNELGAYYLWKRLHLKQYLMERQLPKLGLRFFFGRGSDPFESRPEIGPKVFPPFPTYQLDRGRLENDLRELVTEMGVTLLENITVEDVLLRQNGEPHVVVCRQPGDPGRLEISARWVVDALGRRRLLQSKFDLTLPNGHSASAAWWRVNARLDVAAMGTKADKKWQQRIIEDRNLSTNHLMGRGYWVWLIPLASGATSIGIVTDETIHPIDTYGKSYSQALEWLREHEPAAWQLLKDLEVLDFHRLKNFSYHTCQIFSHHRWSCVGEAGLFLDPLYSLGSDFIAIGNTITVEMIRRDFQAELTEAAVSDFNRLVLDLLAPIGLAYYKDTYRTFGHAHIFTGKLAWDTAVYWSVLAQSFIQNIIRQPTPEVFAVMNQYKELNERVQRLLIDWAEAAPPRALFVTHADLTRMKLHQLLHLDMATLRNSEQFLRVARLNLDRLEELAQNFFFGRRSGSASPITCQRLISLCPGLMCGV